MWIFTTKGFISIAQHKTLPEHFQVKARVASPLEELWPDHEIEVIDWADYRFRITIEKSDALPTLLKVMGSVDYISFKDACGHDNRYHLALTKIWNIMYSYQGEMESLI